MTWRKRVERSLAGAVLLFAALGDPTRLTLLQRLSDGGPASISMLAERFRAMTRQGVRKHLHVLAAAGLINGSRQGREHVWALNPKRLAEGSPVPRGHRERVGRCPGPFEAARRRELIVAGWASPDGEPFRRSGSSLAFRSGDG